MEQKKNADHVKAMEAKIRELDIVIGNMPGNVYWLDCNNVYLGCNDIQAEWLNFSSRRDIVGKTNHMIWPHQAEELNSRNRSVMLENKAYIGEEIAFTKDQEIVFLSHKVPLHDEKGQVIGLLGVSLDITDRKRMEKELKIAKEIADIANQTKTEFIRNMEHDIRTPLSGVISVANHLQFIEQDSQKKEFLNDIQIATQELLNYLDNIFEFSQINTGSVPLIAKEFNLLFVLQGISNLESAALKEKNLNLMIDYSPDAPKIVVGDRFRIHRALLNLVNNAIKFTHEGYVKVSVRLAGQTRTGEVVLKISVEDTGLGIDKKNHEKIFDKFTRCDPSNKGIYKGTGLGLWVVKQFLNDLKGNISLQSEIGKGSIFTCEIPFKL